MESTEFSFSVPNELLPALIAEFHIVKESQATLAETPEEYFIESILRTLQQRAQTYRVGPYFRGPRQPQFLQDGTPNPSYNPEDA
jgi:hypothetical protein